MADLRSRLARGTVGPAAVAGAAVALTAMLAAVLLALGGYDPRSAAAAAARGAFGSADAVLSITIVRAVPLVLTGLAVALAFRAGAWNIGAEGQLYAGAVAGVGAGAQRHPHGQPRDVHGPPRRPLRAGLRGSGG